MEIGDKVIVDSGYTFDGEVGIVIGFYNGDKDCPMVEVPTYEDPKSDDDEGWALDGWKPYPEEGQETP